VFTVSSVAPWLGLRRLRPDQPCRPGVQSWQRSECFRRGHRGTRGRCHWYRIVSVEFLGLQERQRIGITNSASGCTVRLSNSSCRTRLPAETDQYFDVATESATYDLGSQCRISQWPRASTHWNLIRRPCGCSQMPADGELSARIKEGGIVVFGRAYVEFEHLWNLEPRGVWWVPLFNCARSWHQTWFVLSPAYGIFTVVSYSANIYERNDVSAQSALDCLLPVCLGTTAGETALLRHFSRNESISFADLLRTGDNLANLVTNRPVLSSNLLANAQKTKVL
jgi:hypothetical protein